MPHFAGFSLERQLSDHDFEAAIYDLLRNDQQIRPAKLKYARSPRQHTESTQSAPSDLSGRRMFVFQKVEGDTNVFASLSTAQQLIAIAPPQKTG